MLDGPASRISCPRCDLDIRLQTASLSLDRCPRCYAGAGVIVPINRGRDAQATPWGEAEFAHLMITTERAGARVVLALHGNVDMAAEPCLMQAVRRAQGIGPAHVVIDLSAVQFIDWVGLQILIRARREVLARGNRLTMLRGPLAVHRLFEMTGALELFSFED